MRVNWQYWGLSRKQSIIALKSKRGFELQGVFTNSCESQETIMRHSQENILSLHWNSQKLQGVFINSLWDSRNNNEALSKRWSIIALKFTRDLEFQKLFINLARVKRQQRGPLRKQSITALEITRCIELREVFINHCDSQNPQDALSSLALYWKPTRGLGLHEVLINPFQGQKASNGASQGRSISLNWKPTRGFELQRIFINL